MALKLAILVTSVLVIWDVDYSCSDFVPPRGQSKLWILKADPAGEADLNKVTDARKNFIVQKHNELRARVVPPATDMKTMTWDDELAKFAQEWAKCGLPYRHRNDTKGFGENLGRIWTTQPLNDIIFNIDYSIDRWWNESQYYNYQDAECMPGANCGHYTQLVWATTSLVGCAWKMNCPMTISGVLYKFTFLLVCNYEPIGNKQYLDPITHKHKNYHPYTEKTTSITTTTSAATVTTAAAPTTAATTTTASTTTTAAAPTTTATTTTAATTTKAATAITPASTATTTSATTETTTTLSTTTSSAAIIRPPIWTYGGTARGANCSFPFIFDNAEHNDCVVSIKGETAWCKTTNGKWGYCSPEAMRDEQPCVDKLSTCQRLVNKFMAGRCPDASHESAYIDFMKDNCPATCGHCDCPVKVCQHGGKLNACVCKCVGGWIGGDCAVCPITECKNGETFDASTCSCHCASPYGGVDCGCTDSTENFSSRGRHWWRCSLTWLLTKKICGSPFFGPNLRVNCPVSCRSCVHPAFKSRQ